MIRVDQCIAIKIIALWKNKFRTLGSCCGHGRYPKTIIITAKDGENREIYSNKIIPRKRKFYKKDKEGYYYIPEVKNERKPVC
jgi:hypothetical protein